MGNVVLLCLWLIVFSVVAWIRRLTDVVVFMLILLSMPFVWAALSLRG
jgi:hypothetical protein